MAGFRVLVSSGGTRPLPFLSMVGEARCESWGDNEAGCWSISFPFPSVVRLELLLESQEEDEEEGTHWWYVSPIQCTRHIESKIIGSSMSRYLKRSVICTCIVAGIFDYWRILRFGCCEPVSARSR